MEAFLHRLLLAWFAAVFLAAPLAASPLCRDSKGLFTPCPRDSGNRIVNTPVDHAASAAQDEERATAEAEKHKRHHAKHPDEPETPGLVSRGKLCRDSKGLFTPCPR
jgi:hypothetical protein